MHQGGAVRDDREERCRLTHSLGEKDAGCGLLPPPGQGACIWSGQFLKKGNIPSHQSRKFQLSREKQPERWRTGISQPPRYFASILGLPTHLLLMTTLRCRVYYPHFKDEETEAQGDQAPSPRSQS